MIAPDEDVSIDERWVSWGSGRPRNYFVYQHIPARVKATFVNEKLNPFDYLRGDIRSLTI